MAKKTLSFRKKADGTGTLTVKGDLDIYKAGELQAALSGALDAAERVGLDFKDVGNMDLSCLQIICSAVKTAAAKDRAVAFRDGRSGAYEQAIKDAGYADIVAERGISLNKGGRENG